MLTPAFEALGFTEKEQQVYVALVETGKCSATTLSKQVRIPRATLYAVLESLVQKGVISREPIRGSRLFIPNQLSALSRIVEQQKAQIVENEKAARAIRETLAPNLKASGLSTATA